MRFRPEQHLRRQSDIRAVREQGRRVDCRAFTLWWHRRPAGAEARAGNVTPPAPDRRAGSSAGVSAQGHTTARVCVVASTAAVGAAVQRNRAKRRLREIFRQRQHLVPAGCDLLLVARAAATSWPLAELEKKFSEACGQIAPPAAPEKND
jgi:ribonuclease P protein component